MIGLMIVLLSSGIVSGQSSDFKINALPVGRGEGLVLECPSSDIAVIDLGSSQSATDRFWNTNEMNTFFSDSDRFKRIKNIVITNYDEDHYNLLPKVFNSPSKLPALENIYITRTQDKLPGALKTWIANINTTGNVTVKLINGGRQFCSLPQDPVIDLKLCPRDRSFTSKVLFANLGTARKTSMDSIVLLIKYNQFSALLNSDFDDIPRRACGRKFTKADKKAQYKKMKAIVFKLAHHGSISGNANNDDMLKVISPKAIFVSANPWHKPQNYGLPRCHIIDYLRTTIKALCEPASNCGKRFQAQSTISCCVGRRKCKTVSNKHAVYMTTPSKNKMSLITLSTNGNSWEFSYTNYARPTMRVVNVNKLL